MNRDRIGGPLKPKGHVRKGWGQNPGDEHLAERELREHATNKTQRAFTVRQVEARDQIRDMRSRY